MFNQKISRSVGTHDGSFHADEVTACALLWLFDCIDVEKIVRTRDSELLSRCEYVCDVGGVYDPSKKLFDHHQAEYQGPYSSAGMILSFLKDSKLISQKEYDFFNHSIIIGVDAHDNGKELQAHGVCTYSHIISSFTPIIQGSDAITTNQAFLEALQFAKNLLERMLKRYHYIQSCRQMVEEAMRSSKECLVFEKNIPWIDTFFELGGVNHPAQFVIMPSDNHWKLRGIPPNEEDRMQVRMPLPKKWAGLLEHELKAVTGIDGAIFCHKGRFISVWETRQDAEKALALTLAER